MRKSFGVTLTLGLLMLFTLIFMFSPFFTVTEIVLTGCEKITEQTILTSIGLDKPTNIFLFNVTNANKILKENLYIEQVTFEKTYPRTLTIQVRERHLSGYVEYMQGKYLYIDENGRVLEINSFFTEKLPVVSGLKFDKIRLGELLTVDDPAAFRTIVVYARLLNKYQLTDLVSRIEVSDNNNTRIMIYNLDVQLGSREDEDADMKIRIMKAALENLPNAENVRGSLDIREVGSPLYVLKIMQ